MVLLLLVARVASASCGQVGPLLDLAQQALVHQDLEKATAQLDAAQTILACGTPVTTDEVVQLRLLQGTLAILAGDADRAEQRFGAARRLDPDRWIDELGPDLRALWEGAATPEGSGQLRVVPQPVPASVWVDGVPRGPTTWLPPGLVLVQVGDLQDGTTAMHEVVIQDKGLHQVESGLPTGTPPETELSAKASRDWARLANKAKGEGPKEIRTRLLAFIETYQAPAALAREWLPELDRARAKLEETEDQLRGGFSGTSLSHLDEEPPPALGLVASVGGGWLAGGAAKEWTQQVTAAPFGGLGLEADAGIGWRPTPALLTRLTVGYQSILLDLGSSDQGDASDVPTRHHGASGWIAAGTSLGPVQVLAGPAAFVGQVRTSGQLVADPDAAAPAVTGSVQAYGGRLGVDLPMLAIGGHALALNLGGGLMLDGERSYARGTLGVGIVPGG